MGDPVQRYDASSAECLIFTYKEGLLSAIAHDLMLRVDRFAIEVSPAPGGWRIDARFAADSVHVVCSLRGGDPHQQSPIDEGDRRKIERATHDEVLQVARHPEIRFEGTATATAAGYEAVGELTLHGVTRPLRLTSHAAGASQVGEVVIHQPDYGIKVFTAMLGTLKIRPDVRIRVTLPTPPA